MEQQTAAPPPPPLTATTTVTTATTTTHPSSVDFSPRSRNTDSWIEDSSLYPSNNGSTAATTGGLTKLRLMCSYGGHIVPRPHDKSLCYVGGDTRIVVVDRHTTLPDLTHRLTKTLLRSSSTSSATASFTIKYQLPSEDLDSLISVTTDEDLENMIDEYDRLNRNSSSDCRKSSRIRVFLFPIKPESVSSIGSLLESTTKSEDWFLNALNGTSSGFSDTSSVNCLLGLEDDVPVQEKKDVENKYVIGKTLRGNNNNSVQDVQSVPDSPMLETTSSFGSASSSPSLANVPPVTVIVDDQQKVAEGIEEQFSQMSVQQYIKHHEAVNFVAEPVPVMISGMPIGSSSTVAITENPNLNPNPNPNPNRVLSEDEGSEQSFQSAHHKQQQQQQQFQPKLSTDSVSSDGKLPVIYQDPAALTQFPTTNIIDQNTRIQLQQQQIKDSAYLLPPPTAKLDPQTHQMHHQPQFIHTASPPPPQYLHHHPSMAVPMAPFYQIYPSQTQYHTPHPTLDQHNLVYYMPAARQPPPNNQVVPPSGLITTPQAVQVQPANTTTEPPAGMYRTATISGASAPSSQQQIQPQFVGYSRIHQPVASGASGGNYVYKFADPLQQGQHVYYPGQHLPPQSAAQYQTMASNLPVEAQAGSNLQAGNGMNQQVRTPQP